MDTGPQLARAFLVATALVAFGSAAGCSSSSNTTPSGPTSPPTGPTPTPGPTGTATPTPSGLNGGTPTPIATATPTATPASAATATPNAGTVAVFNVSSPVPLVFSPSTTGTTQESIPTYSVFSYALFVFGPATITGSQSVGTAISLAEAIPCAITGPFPFYNGSGLNNACGPGLSILYFQLYNGTQASITLPLTKVQIQGNTVSVFPSANCFLYANAAGGSASTWTQVTFASQLAGNVLTFFSIPSGPANPIVLPPNSSAATYLALVCK